MHGTSTRYNAYFAARDKKLAALKSRLSLAHASRNKQEVTRITREVTRLSQSL